MCVLGAVPGALLAPARPLGFGSSTQEVLGEAREPHLVPDRGVCPEGRLGSAGKCSVMGAAMSRAVGVPVAITWA